MSYYIASIKHTHKHSEHIVWWGANHCGYTPVIGPNIGAYSEEEAANMNDGVDCIAVPRDAVSAVLSPEPYFKPGARFYDQRGPVTDNTRKVWSALIAASLAQGRSAKPKPEIFRGRRRSFSEPTP